MFYSLLKDKKRVKDIEENILSKNQIDKKNIEFLLEIYEELHMYFNYEIEDYKKCLKFLTHILKIIENIRKNKLLDEEKIIIEYSYYLSMKADLLNFDLKKKEKALKIYNKCLEINKKNFDNKDEIDLKNRIKLYDKIADIYYDKKNLEKYIYYNKKILDFLKNSEVENESSINSNLLKIYDIIINYYKDKDNISLMKYFYEKVDFLEDLKNSNDFYMEKLIETFKDISRFYFKKDNKKAFYYFNKAQKYYRNYIKNFGELHDNLDFLDYINFIRDKAQMYEEINRLKLSLKYLLKTVNLYKHYSVYRKFENILNNYIKIYEIIENHPQFYKRKYYEDIIEFIILYKKEENINDKLEKIIEKLKKIVNRSKLVEEDIKNVWNLV